MRRYVCMAEGCNEDEYEAVVFRGSVGRVVVIGYCELHADTCFELYDPPAGFEAVGGGGDPALVREVFCAVGGDF